MKAFTQRALGFMSVVILSCCLFGCSEQSSLQDKTEQEGQQEEAITYRTGDSVETDILRFTLDRAELAFALDNSGAATFGPNSNGLAQDSYFMPKEYDPEDDANNPYVAAKGHTLVSVTISVENLDRDYVELEGLASTPLFTIEYDGTIYPNDESSSKGDDNRAKIGAENKNGEGWKDYKVNNILLHVGEVSSYKCYVDIPVEVENLDGAFKVIVNLPNSADETECFEYVIEG